MIGGYDGNYLSRVEILDTAESSQWYHPASLPQPLSPVLPAIIGSVCFPLGGFAKEGASKKVFSVSLSLDHLISQAFPNQLVQVVHHTITMAVAT